MHTTVDAEPSNPFGIGGSFGTPVSLAEPGSRAPAGIMDHANTIGFRAARSLER